MRPWLGRIPGGLLRRPALLVIPLVVFALYTPCVNLPFFWDDAANFGWMYTRPLRSIWVDATGFPYYRPLGFTLWRALQAAVGPTALIPFHLVNLAVHSANALLVGGLAARFVSGTPGGVRAAVETPRRGVSEACQRHVSTGHERVVAAGQQVGMHPPGGGSWSARSLAGLTASLLMALFPFSALSLCHVSQTFHLFVTLLALTAVACVLRYSDTGRAAWGVLAIITAALAPFAHEYGVTTGGLMLLAVLTVPVAPSLDRSSRRGVSVCLAAIALNLAFLPWWVYVPKARAETFAWVGWESLAQSAVFFLEGLTFPFQFPARWLMEALGWTDMAAVSVLGGLGLGLGIAVLLRAERRLRSADQSPAPRPLRVLALSLGYWLLASAPGLLALPFSYIVVSSRLQVFPSPAAAILWGIVIPLAAQWASRRVAQVNPALLQLGLAALAVAAPVVHIARTVRLHVVALSPVRVLTEAVSQTPSQRQLVINAPNWVAPVRADYALGHEGVEIMPDYVPPQLLVWTNTGIQAPLDGVAFPNVFPQLQDYYFSAWGPAEDWMGLAARLPEYERVWLWHYADDELALLEAGSAQPGAATPPGSSVASFDGRVWLLSARVALEGNQARLDLQWRSTAAAGEDVFAHVLDCGGQVLGQRDGATLGGVYPLWLWPAGVYVHDVRHIPLAETPRDGCYRVEIGLFDPADGSRTPVYGPGGDRLANDTFVLEP